MPPATRPCAASSTSTRARRPPTSSSGTASPRRSAATSRRRPTPETAACASAWSAERPLLESLVALYAIESGQPAISETKRAGLVEHYGADAGSDMTAYFDLHAVRDVEHAAQERALIEPLIADADVEALLAEAESVLRANWELLDGVERLNGRS